MRSSAESINRSIPDVREAFLELGLNTVTASAAIPFAWFLPTTTDGFSPIIATMVIAMQRYMGRMGFRTPPTGVMDAPTRAAVERLVGPDWQSLPWITIVGAVIDAKKRGVRASNSQGGTMQGGAMYAMGYVDAKDWGHTDRQNCKPVNSSTLAIFKNLQLQTNRVNKAFGGGAAVAEDGIIGPKTIDAVKRAGSSRASGTLAITSRAAIAAVTSCDSLARIADNLADEFEKIANAAGAPASVSTPISKHSVTVDPSTGAVAVQPSLAAIVPFDLTPTTLGILAVGGAAALAYWQKGRKTRRRRRR